MIFFLNKADELDNANVTKINSNTSLQNLVFFLADCEEEVSAEGAGEIFINTPYLHTKGLSVVLGNITESNHTYFLMFNNRVLAKNIFEIIDKKEQMTVEISSITFNEVNQFIGEVKNALIRPDLKIKAEFTRNMVKSIQDVITDYEIRKPTRLVETGGRVVPVSLLSHTIETQKALRKFKSNLSAIELGNKIEVSDLLTSDEKSLIKNQLGRAINESLKPYHKELYCYRISAASNAVDNLFSKIEIHQYIDSNQKIHTLP